MMFLRTNIALLAINPMANRSWIETRCPAALKDAPMAEILMTTKEVAAELRVSQNRVIGWRIDGGGPPCLRLGYSKVRYNRRDVIKFKRTYVKGSYKKFLGEARFA